jgi:hypothetical protein
LTAPLFTEDLWRRMCLRIASGESLRTLCAAEDMPDKSTVLQWLHDDKDGKLQQDYARAKAVAAYDYADRMQALVELIPNENEKSGGYDSAHVNLIGKQMQGLQWLAAVCAPRKYGVRPEVEGGGNELDAFRAVVADVLARRPKPPPEGSDATTG